MSVYQRVNQKRSQVTRTWILTGKHPSLVLRHAFLKRCMVWDSWFCTTSEESWGIANHWLGQTISDTGANEISSCLPSRNDTWQWNHNCSWKNLPLLLWFAMSDTGVYRVFSKPHNHSVMWVKQCRFYHPSLGMVNPPPYREVSHEKNADFHTFLYVYWGYPLCIYIYI